MLQGRRNLNLLFHPIRVSVFLLCAISGARAENVILYLKNGDRITGSVVSEYTNRVVLSNSWAKELSIPLAEISRREITIVAGTNQVAGTNTVALVKLPLPKVTLPPPPPLFKHWKGEAELGVDLIYSTSDQRDYHARFKLSYERPYASNTNHFFRNTLDYAVEYGRTEQTIGKTNVAVTSSDRMGGSIKTSWDFDGHTYAYNLAGAGYDRVRRIDFQAEEGPGLGYHLIRLTNLVANVESGANYQIQYLGDHTHTRDFFFRLAEDVNWKINPQTTFTQKAEFFPRVNFEEYRLRAEATLSYNLWRYVYLNLTVRDSYDTRPAAGASPNELAFHSALGVKF
jgi:hypothetical protein